MFRSDAGLVEQEVRSLLPSLAEDAEDVGDQVEGDQGLADDETLPQIPAASLRSVQSRLWVTHLHKSHPVSKMIAIIFLICFAGNCYAHFLHCIT